MPPPDRPEVLPHKARHGYQPGWYQVGGSVNSPDYLSRIGAAWCRYKGGQVKVGRGKTVAEAVKKICVTLSSSSGAK